MAANGRDFKEVINTDPRLVDCTFESHVYFVFVHFGFVHFAIAHFVFVHFAFAHFMFIR